MQAEKALTLTSVLVLVSIIASPMLTATADAALVLESPAAATASIGDSFGIVARGRGGFRADDLNDFTANYQARMNLDFLIARHGERGVILQAITCTFSINNSIYNIDDGVGFAGRTQRSQINGTILFGFRINVSDSCGDTGQLEFIGQVRRTENYGPLLIMRGRLVLDNMVFVFAQVGSIHRVQL